MTNTLCASMSLVVHLMSFHTAPGYETMTPGIGIVCERPPAHVGVGVFRNSIGRDSFYMIAGAETQGTIRVGAVMGAATGYLEKSVQPLAGVTFTTDMRDFQLRLLVIPLREKTERDGVVFHFMLSKGF